MKPTNPAAFGDHYRTAENAASSWRRRVPTAAFYVPFLADVIRSGRQAKRGQYDDQSWIDSSLRVMHHLERVGVRFEIDGLEHLRRMTTSGVLVGNHMSMLETMVLPGIIQPIIDVTFVVKQSLMDYPLFKHVLRSRHPIPVRRDQPREDFKVVMNEGTARLSDGISVVVFPQTTRQVAFDPEAFNSIGTKLARRGGVPVVPIALRTDAWGNGNRIKDFGAIDPTRPVRIRFGEPIDAEMPAAETQQRVVEFIGEQLSRWSRDDD